jgi:hypothetical protein
VFDKFPNYYKLYKEDNSNPTTGNESLHEISIDNGIRVVRFATCKTLTVKISSNSANINKYAWTSPDGKTHNQIDYILIDRRRHSSVLDVRSFRKADCDTDHHLFVAKFKDRLAVIKQSHRFHKENFNLKKLN